MTQKMAKNNQDILCTNQASAIKVIHCTIKCIAQTASDDLTWLKAFYQSKFK